MNEEAIEFKDGSAVALPELSLDAIRQISAAEEAIVFGLAVTTRALEAGEGDEDCAPYFVKAAAELLDAMAAVRLEAYVEHATALDLAVRLELTTGFARELRDRADVLITRIMTTEVPRPWSCDLWDRFATLSGKWAAIDLEYRNSLLAQLEQTFQARNAFWTSEWSRRVPRGAAAEAKKALDTLPKGLVPSFIERLQEHINTLPPEEHCKATQGMIWRAAGHTDARQFQYWKEDSSKATATDRINFPRILNDTPANLLKTLKAIGAFPRNVKASR